MNREEMKHNVDKILAMGNPYENPLHTVFTDNHPNYTYKITNKNINPIIFPKPEVYMESFEYTFTESVFGLLLTKYSFSDDPEDLIFYADIGMLEEYMGIVICDIRCWLSVNNIKNTEGHDLVLKYDWEHSCITENFSPLTINREFVDLLPEDLRATVPAKYIH